MKDQGVDFFEFCKIKVGNGCNTRFWKDRWCDAGILKDKFPRLFALKVNKDVSIKSKILADRFQSSFRHEAIGGGGAEYSKLEEI